MLPLYHQLAEDALHALEAHPELLFSVRRFNVLSPFLVYGTGDLVGGCARL